MCSNMLCLLFLCLKLYEAAAFNLLTKEQFVKYMHSAVVKKNATTASWEIPSGTIPMFYGYRLTLVTTTNTSNK